MSGGPPHELVDAAIHLDLGGGRGGPGPVSVTIQTTPIETDEGGDDQPYWTPLRG